MAYELLIWLFTDVFILIGFSNFRQKFLILEMTKWRYDKFHYNSSQKMTEIEKRNSSIGSGTFVQGVGHMSVAHVDRTGK